MNQQELLKSVNPSYTTGKGCLAMLFGTGDPDAAELVKTIDLSELQKNNSTPDNQTTKDIPESVMFLDTKSSNKPMLQAFCHNKGLSRESPVG